MSSVLAIWLTPIFHLPLILASWLLARRLGGNVLRTAVDAFLIGCVLWRLETLVLNPFGALHWAPILGLHLALLLVVWLGVSWFRSQKDSADSSALDLPPPTSKSDPRSPIVARVAAAWLAVIGALALYRVLQLPDPYDSLTYHLMLPAAWLQSGSLDLVPTTFGHIAPTYTPEAVEGFFFGLLLPTGHDAWARIGQVPFVIIGAYLIFDIARTNSSSESWVPCVAASAYLLLPDLLVQGTGSMVDVAATTYFLASWQARQRWLSSRSPALLWLAGATAGLFVASRVPALLFAPFLLLPWLFELRVDVRSLARLAIPLLCTGAYPYLRNLVLTGNPLYPIQIDLGESLSLPGLFTREATKRAVFHLEGKQLWQYYGYYLRGSGILWCALGAFAPVLVAVSKTRTRVSLPSIAWASGVGLAVTLVLLFVIPFNANGRFLFPAWGLFVVAASVGLGRSRVGRGLLLGALGYLVVDALRILPEVRDIARGSHLLFSAGLVGVGALGFNLAWLTSQLSPRLRWISCAFVLVGAVIALGIVDMRRETQLGAIYRADKRQGFAAFAKGWEIVRALPGELRIAYTGANLPYLLVGPRLLHQVTVVPLDGSPAGLLPHEHRERLGDSFRPSPITGELALDRIRSNEQAWHQRVLDEKIDVLAVYLKRGKRPEEYEWALASPEHFELLNSGDDGGSLKIFRVKR